MSQEVPLLPYKVEWVQKLARHELTGPLDENYTGPRIGLKQELQYYAELLNYAYNKALPVAQGVDREKLTDYLDSLSFAYSEKNSECDFARLGTVQVMREALQAGRFDAPKDERDRRGDPCPNCTEGSIGPRCYGDQPGEWAVTCDTCGMKFSDKGEKT